MENETTYEERQAELDAGAEPKWYEVLDANLPEGFRAELSPAMILTVTGPDGYEEKHLATRQGQYEALSTAWSAVVLRGSVA